MPLAQEAKRVPHSRPAVGLEWEVFPSRGISNCGARSNRLTSVGKFRPGRSMRLAGGPSKPVLLGWSFSFHRQGINNSGTRRAPRKNQPRMRRNGVSPGRYAKLIGAASAATQSPATKQRSQSSGQRLCLNRQPTNAYCALRAYTHVLELAPLCRRARRRRRACRTCARRSRPSETARDRTAASGCTPSGARRGTRSSGTRRSGTRRRPAPAAR